MSAPKKDSVFQSIIDNYHEDLDKLRKQRVQITKEARKADDTAKIAEIRSQLGKNFEHG
jgi:hypothetical protein